MSVAAAAEVRRLLEDRGTAPRPSPQRRHRRLPLCRGRRTGLHLARPAPFTSVVLDGLRRLDARAAPG